MSRPRPVRRVDWSLALCAQDDPEQWFSETLADIERAKAVCGQCAIRPGCYEAAVSRDERAGVWGGVLFGQRALKRAAEREARQEAAS